ncbi:MAG: 16S rRNA (uracil(1498)-N(3))-methyltransferase [Muribaculaceae bacterium]|nr:16S rRNA (uracil(1498)-N(3))-methyltransferase [Muribaculaceae bacterium]
MIRFYCPDLEPGMRQARLPESDSQHCVRVLRMNEGDELEATDGRGHIYSCRLAVAHPKRAELEITDCREQPKVWAPRITVAVAPTKHLDRMEWLVEKLVEIGVDRIVAVRCRRSERKELKTERLEKIAVSAMKQSLKAVLPEVTGPMALDEFLRECGSEPGQKFIGYCDSATERVLLAKAYEPGSDVTILVGPEGDFTPEEVDAALKAGFLAVTMGDNRLRTETAALVGADTVHIINQRML